MAARRSRGLGHRADPVGFEAVDRPQKAVPVELVVGDPHRGAGADHGRRVLLLVAAAERAGDEHHWQPDRGRLGDGADPGSADDQVGACHQCGHVVGEGDPAIAVTRVLGQLVRALLPGDVHHLLEPLAQPVEGRPHRLVEPARALASASDQQPARRHVRRPRLEAPTEGNSGRHDTDASQPRFGAGQCRAHGGRVGREVPGRQARPHVLLMQHIRKTADASGGNRGGHHVAAHAEYDVRPEAVDDAERCAQRQRDKRRQREVLPQCVTVEPADPDGFQLETRGRDEPLLRAALAPDEQDGTARFLSAKRPRDRERRIQVPAGPAASDQKAHHSDDCSATPNPSRGGRCSAGPRPRPATWRARCPRS